MRKLYQYDEQAHHPHLLEEHYFHKLNPSLVYAGMQGELPGPQNVLHTHPFAEVQFFRHGCGHVLLDKRDYPVREGDILVINAGIPHCEYSDAAEPLTFYFMAYDKINLPNLPPNQLWAENVSPLLRTGRMAEDFHRLFCTVLHELENDRDFGYEIAQTTAKIIIMQLFRLLNQSCDVKEFLQGNRVLQNAMRYIDQNFTDEFSLAELAGECMVSKYYLSHLFTKRMGMPIRQYILNKRMNRAKHLLRDSTLSVEQISHQSGFADSAYFCRLFKKETGLTPTQFRKSVAQQDGVRIDASKIG